MSQVSDCLCKKMGLEFPENRYKDLMRGIEEASKDLGFDNAKDCIEWMINSELNKQTQDTLAKYLTIGETYFLRDSSLFKNLKDKIFHDLIYSRWHKEKYIRIWSAGCCTGEEPYSFAMLIDQILPHRTEWNISIIATDINENFLNKAKKGIYTKWSFRNTPQDIREKYFKKIGENQFSISPKIKKMVSFFHLNLASLNFPSFSKNITEMDLICCRNVLMYFSGTVRDQVVNKFSESLSPNGWLIVSPGEAEHARKAGLKPVRSTETTLFRKTVSKPHKINKYPNYEHTKIDSTINENTKIVLPRNIPDKQNLQQQSTEQKEKIKENSNKAELKYDDAFKFFEKGNYDDSVHLLCALLEIEKNNSEYMALLARCYANLKQNDKASSWCKKAISLDAFNPKYYYLMATIQQEQGQIDLSIKALNQALYLEPSFIMAYMALGMIRRKQGRQKDSEKCMKNALYYLKNMGKNTIVPSSDGMTAGRLVDMLESMN
ncbi:methylase of chemotaxis methyl-accepting protein [Candidatus Magnetomorum sp. HK-1]|nr:methylase of chemotaxis methyl-accepting protein [Candidatus Magnetomorum sp. HK-1]